MRLHCKKPRPLTREEGTFRDDRLFIIATEDTHAPAQYFEIFRNPRIKVRVPSTSEGLSSPVHVLRRLDDFVEEYEMTEDDELWLMLDTDHWVEPNHIRNFTNVCTEATKKQFQLAHSNPCFEIWLLLHVVELNPGDQITKPSDAEEFLRRILGEYNKCRIDCKKFPREAIEAAIGRAKKLDEAPEDRWPRKTGSHVYRIVEKLL